MSEKKVSMKIECDKCHKMCDITQFWLNTKDATRKKAQQELIKKIEKLVNKRIKELNVATDPLLWGCANELKYFWKDVKKEVEK